MQTLKITLTALLLATTVAGSALAADSTGEGSTGSGDRIKHPTNNTMTTGSDTYANPTAASQDPETKNVGATRHSGETQTDKTLLNKDAPADNSASGK